jgi:uncharacterized membrane protein
VSTKPPEAREGIEPSPTPIPRQPSIKDLWSAIKERWPAFKERWQRWPSAKELWPSIRDLAPAMRERWPSIRNRWERWKRWPSVQELWPEVAPTGYWIAAALVLSIALALCHSPLVPLPGVVTLLLVPGAVVMSALRTRPANIAARLVLAVCLSMMVVMVVGGLVSLIGPVVGLAHPLNAPPEYVIWIVLAILALAMSARSHSDPVTWIFDGVQTTQVASALACGLLVVLSILGAAQINHSGDDRLAIFATTLDVVVLLAGIVGGWNRASRWPLNSVLYFASLALLVSTSLRGGHLYGWDIQEEFGVAARTLRTGVWVIPANHDPYASMLSLTVLPAILHSLFKLRLVAFFELVVPAILALLPLAVFNAVRAVPRWITSGRTTPRPGLAFAVVVSLIVSSEAFSSELVTITRQAMALTMVAALVMVLFDRTILKRPAQILVGLLLVAISFTHYTTSYLMAAILLCAWPVSVMWSRGWLGTPRKRIDRHRHEMRSRSILNGALVSVALVAAFGWNLGITRNGALQNPVSAVTARGADFTSSTEAKRITPDQFEQLLEREVHKADKWLVPLPSSRSVHLVAANFPFSHGVVPKLKAGWNELSFLTIESIWILLGIALLYGLFRLGRRRSYEYSSDLVGLGVTGLLVGGILRFSGTLAAYFDPERAAIFTEILLAVPVTLFLDDAVSLLLDARVFYMKRVRQVLYGVGSAVVAVLVVGATGLGALFFGGDAPGSMSANDLNAEEFVVSTPEVATAAWLYDNVHSPRVVQSDFIGQVVLHSAPGTYDLLPEIVPPEVDDGAFIYLSPINLAGNLSQAATPDGVFQSAYRSNIQFFNQNFYVVYSTGATRVYH